MTALDSHLELTSCLPALDGVDWSLVGGTHFAFVGTGAVNRPLARQLAWLGMKECLLIDPKNYKPQSAVSQCEPNEVGKEKAVVVAEELKALGVKATVLVKDIDVVPPGFLKENGFVIAAVDNRRADILANRWAARMRRPLIKVNVEPSYLTASIRCYDFRNSPLPLCAECQMTDRHYEQQLHPLSCDGGAGEQATGSPRPLSQLAADAAALAIAQIVGSPEHWAPRWWGKQWQQNLLGGGGGFSELHAKPGCRWDHCESWQPLVRITDWSEVSLRDLARNAGMKEAGLKCEFSARVSKQAICSTCHQPENEIRFVPELDQALDVCGCGGEVFAIPYFAANRLSRPELNNVWDRPVADWGITPGSVVRFSTGDARQTFCFEAREP